MQRLAPEIDLIQSPDIKAFVQAALQKAPAYFWTITSSTSGKHHPPDERGPGGRVLHTKRVVRLCAELAQTFDLVQEYTDTLIASALLHDIVVNGPFDEPFTSNWKQHDVAVKEHLLELAGAVGYSRWELITRICAGHMGRWASDPAWQPNPGTLSYLLHIADVIASRSWVLVEPL